MRVFVKAGASESMNQMQTVQVSACNDRPAGRTKVTMLREVLVFGAAP